MKILLVDDDAMIRDSLSIILSNEPNITIVGTCANGQEALTFVKDTKVDVILMDIRMPVMNGIEACTHIKASNPAIKIIMLTTFHDFKNVHQALHAGANGYILKSDAVDTQITTINNVYHGQAVFSSEALQALTKKHHETLLTDRENSCLELVAQGYSNKEIAQRLYIGEGTVRNVISIILEKLALRDRTQLAIYYWQTRQSQD